jgi:PPOX class probable FMN-dependent enzyme
VAEISDLAALRCIIGEPSVQVPHKIHRQLNQRASAFIARSPMLFLATTDAQGQPTVSPKGDAPGFVRVVDERTLVLPERKGNKLIFSLRNILASPRIGLIFLVPGTDETLRVSGRATLRDDAPLCASFEARGRPALLVMEVQVIDCYFHCAKAFLRSALWNPQVWSERLPISFGAEIAQSGGLAAGEVEAFDRAVQGRYETDL